MCGELPLVQSGAAASPVVAALDAFQLKVPTAPSME